MSTSSKSGRSYTDAIECLNGLQSNAATINAIRAAGPAANPNLIPESIDYLKRIGYSPEDLNKLNVLHITGTKGKGSTSAFCSSILTTLAPEAKVGLYTSPHMVAVRERIRINGRPLSEEKFARYFFEVWDRFETNKERIFPETPEKPAYFRYLTTLAYHVFLSEKVDATILEVGIGGTYDSTNIVPKPLTTGVTALGIDHIFVLGRTLEEIAHQKGGIYKAGVPALTVEQPPNGLQVLRVRAAELKSSSFDVVPEHPGLRDIKLGLAGVHQRSNASMALALVQTFLASPALPAAFNAHRVERSTSATSQEDILHPAHLQPSLLSPSPIPDLIVKGLQETRWPGRCQVIEDRQESRKGVTWYLDGAHTVESLLCCGEWFAEAATKSRKRVLIFNCTSGRSAQALLGSLTDAMAGQHRKLGSPQGTKSLFSHAIFCTNVTYSSGDFKGDLSSKMVDNKDLVELTVQHELEAAWKQLAQSADSEVSNDCEVRVLPSIQDAVALVQQVQGDKQEQVDVLVTGSLHLVGGIFEAAHLDFAL